MDSHVLSLSVTLAPLGDDVPAVLTRLTGTAMRQVQLSAAQAGLRPRELDTLARRGLREKLRRLELEVSGIDAWIPAEHFVHAEHAERALDALHLAMRMAADLGRVPVSVALPRVDATLAARRNEAIIAIEGWSEHLGVLVADHATPREAREIIGVGIDPAAILAEGGDPAMAVVESARRLVSARLCDLLRTGMRGPIGDGSGHRLDVEGYAAAIQTCGFARAVVVDLRQWADPWGGLAQTQARWASAGVPGMPGL